MIETLLLYYVALPKMKHFITPFTEMSFVHISNWNQIIATTLQMSSSILKCQVPSCPILKTGWALLQGKPITVRFNILTRFSMWSSIIGDYAIYVQWHQWPKKPESKF